MKKSNYLGITDFKKRHPEKKFNSRAQEELFGLLCDMYNYSDLPQGLGTGKTWTFQTFEEYLKEKQVS